MRYQCSGLLFNNMIRFFSFNIWDLLVNRLKTLHCRLNGHIDSYVIEPYQTTHYLKNYIRVANKIIYGPPYPVIQVKGKLKCKFCGEVYIGVIVKANHNHEQCQ